MDSFCLVYITVPNVAEAQKISKLLIDAQLIACANILPGMQSIYRWEGAVVEDTEVLLLTKTRKDLLEELTACVKANHSYTCPCIVSFGIEYIETAYLSWLKQELKP